MALCGNGDKLGSSLLSDGLLIFLWSTQISVVGLIRDWSKSMRGGGGWAGPERGWVMSFWAWCKGWVGQFSATLRGVGHPILLHRKALTTNETVDNTCYIKLSQLELMLKYSQTCWARKWKKMKKVTGRTPTRAWNPLLTFFFALTSMSFNDFPFL